MKTPSDALAPRSRKSPSPLPAQSSGEPADIVERLCAEQRARWLRGDRVPAEELLRGCVANQSDAELAVDLIYSEFIIREQLGEAPQPEEYVTRFPQFADLLKQQFEFFAALGAALPKLCGSPQANSSKSTRTGVILNDQKPFVRQGPCDVLREISLAGDARPAAGATFVSTDAQALRPRAHPSRIGRFEIRDRVGEGGFATVYRAFDPQLGREIALKMPHPHLVTEEYRARFAREAWAAAQLQHPNIVAVFDCGIAQDGPYIAYQFVDGQTLANALRQRRFAAREAAELVNKLAQAAHVAHSKGIFHRDLKPANVLLAARSEAIHRPPDRTGTDEPVRSKLAAEKLADFEPLIADFGLARLETESTLTDDMARLGTPAYMSPEQASGASHTADARSDIYSLGVLLYELLTGQLPFQGSTLSVLKQVIENEPRQPRSLCREVPGDLETICLKAMAKRPADRYPSAQHLADDLSRWLRGEPIFARPVGNAERFVRWCRRNPIVATLTASVVLALVGGLAVSTFLWVRADRNALWAIQEKGRADSKATEANRHLYAARMNLAQREWETAQLANVLDLLEKCKPAIGEEDHRGWEWHYLTRLCNMDARASRINAPACSRVAFSPDGGRIAFGSGGEWLEVTVWDTLTNRRLVQLPRLPGGMNGIAFSPDGKSIATASQDRTARLWDATTGEELRLFAGHTDALFCVAFSPDGQTLATSSGDRTVKLWNLRSGQELRTFEGHSAVVRDVAFSPDDRQLATASGDSCVMLWDLTTGRNTQSLKGHSQTVSSVAFSPDGRWLVTTGGDDQTVKIWETTSGKELRTLSGHKAMVEHATFSPRGTLIASCSQDHTIKLWNAGTGRERFTLRGHVASVAHMAFSPDSRRLISGGGDQTVRLWDLFADREFRPLIGHEKMVNAVSISPDGERIASASDDGTIRLWDLISGQEFAALRGHTGMVDSVTFSPDGRLLASAGHDATVRLWNAASGAALQTLSGHRMQVHQVAFSPEGTRLASASRDHTAKLWEIATGEVLYTFVGHTNVVHGVAFSPNGLWLATASDDQAVRIWPAIGGECVRELKGHNHYVYGIAFDRDGKLLASASEDKTVRIWDSTNWSELHTLKGHSSWVYSVAFSPDGRRLVSTGGDNTVKLWDTETGQELCTLKGHAESVYGVAFSPDGYWIASGGKDNTVILWDGRPQTDEIDTEREALAYLRFLIDKETPSSELFEEIRLEPTITESVRQCATKLANRFRVARLR